MRKGLKAAGILVLAVLCLTLLLTLAGRLTDGMTPAGRALQTVSAPVMSLLNRGVTGLERLFAYMHGYDELEAENAALRSRIAEMEEEVRRSQDANAENDHLRRLLGFKSSHSDYTMLDARLTAWGASSWSSTFGLDKGTADGLAVGDCVITADGFLVGVVTEAGKRSCTVRTIIDPQAAVGASLQSTGLTAVAEGDFARMSEGKLVLNYVWQGAALETGDTVLTSGAGGVYPAGLVIGTITGLGTQEGGYGEYGIITPAADLGSLTQLYVILDDGETDDEN